MELELELNVQAVFQENSDAVTVLMTNWQTAEEEINLDELLFMTLARFFSCESSFSRVLDCRAKNYGSDHANAEIKP